ncbi:MAG TPA: hypothetical protein VN882_10345 [Steroidobacteraceae bacterium]|jgi:hypothetical protein|nr:hypothetical protein [Steroidobacteraceae bacterium]
MRFLGAILATLAATSLTPCLADPPASPAAAASQPAPAATPAPAPASTTSQPATAAAQTAASSSAASTAKAATVNEQQEAADEKQLLVQGYTPEMRNGTKMWCKRQEQTGSRLGSHVKTCGTATELAMRQREAQQQFQQEMPGTYGTNPTGGPK